MIPLQAHQASEKATPQFPFSKKGSNNCRGISLILLHTFAKCLIAHSIFTSLGSQKACHICIKLVTTTVLHHLVTVLHPLFELSLPVFFKFVLYINFGCCLDTDPGTSSLGTRPRGRTNKWGTTAEHAISCLCGELMYSINKSGHLDNVKHIVSKLNCNQDDVARSRKRSKSIYIFASPAHLTYNLQNLQHMHLTSATAWHHSWQYIQHTWCLLRVTCIQYPPLNHWPQLRTQTGMWCLLVVKISHCRKYHNPDCDSTSLRHAWERWCWSQPLGSRTHGDLAG